MGIFLLQRDLKRAVLLAKRQPFSERLSSPWACSRDSGVASPSVSTRKSSDLSTKSLLFQLNPSLRTGEIHLRWVKSPSAVKSRFAGCRTDFISPRAISPEDEVRRFHRGFAAISLLAHLYHSVLTPRKNMKIQKKIAKNKET